MTEPKPFRLHAGHIEVAVAKLLDFRKHVIVPNVHWGLGLKHECDMLALDSDGRFTEIEIKVTASDLKADFKKEHGHKSKYISRLIYAMPKELCERHADLIPKEFGIISVSTNSFGVSYPMIKASHYRHARHDKAKEKPPETLIKDFMRLGCMRIWSLKDHNNKPLNYK
jgi:hypothetical protein